MKRETFLAIGALAYCWAPWQIMAGPVVVPTAEGQLGDMLDPANDKITGTTFESLRGEIGAVLLGSNYSTLATPGLPFQFLTDMIHGSPDPVPIATSPGAFNFNFQLPPSSSRSRNAADDGDFVAFSFASDDVDPDSMRIDIAVYDELGQPLSTSAINGLIGFPDPAATDTSVAVDDQGRVTVVYTEIPSGLPSIVAAQRIDGITGLPIGGAFPITDDGHAYSDVAVLDPQGNRLIIPSSDFNEIRGNIVDLTGPTPMVLPEFQISSTPGGFKFDPVVAADPATGNFMVAWEHNTGVQGNPGDIRGRRFDAMGNPIGGDFVVNTTTANTQGQPAIAAGPNGLMAAVWAGEPGVQGNELDVFLQVFDADGNPIGGEIRVNTDTDDVQDKPKVRFLPETDSQGRPQVTVAWRDVGVGDGSMPVGTGTSYKCFSIEGIGDPTAIFADGFESGDTSSWSDTFP